MYDDGTYITYSGRDFLEVGEGIVHLDKWNPNQIFGCLYMDGNQNDLYGKRFQITSQTDEKYYPFVSEDELCKLKLLTDSDDSRVKITLITSGSPENNLIVNLNENNFPLDKPLAMGQKITDQKVGTLKLENNAQTSFL